MIPLPDAVKWSFCALFLFTALACSKTAGKGEAEPQVISIFPQVAGAGDTVTVMGRNLPTDASQAEITLNNKTAEILKMTVDSLSLRLPENAGSGKLQLRVGTTEYETPELTYDYEVIVTTIAGNGSVGNTDGAGENASFNCPWGIAVDKSDNLFVADCYNRLIRKINTLDNSVSTYTIPVLPGGGEFYSPYNIAVDRVSGDIYMTDFNKHILRRKAGGEMSVIYNGEMPLAGIAISPDRNHLFVSNNTTGVILKMDTEGNNVSVFATGLVTPRNIFLNQENKMFVAAYPGPIYEIDPQGVSQRVPGDVDFTGWEVVADTSGNFFLASHFDNTIKMIEKSGRALTIAGSGAAMDLDGKGIFASFNGPQGLTIDSKGNLYVTTFNYDTNGGNKVRKITIR